MNSTLETQIGPALLRNGLWLATAESCTGGLISHRITEIPGASEYFLGGVVAYSNALKQALLGVRAETLDRYGAVSAETVIEMARGARRLGEPTVPVERVVGVSVSGVAGPGGGTAEKPVGLVWIGLSAPGGEWARAHQWDGDRSTQKILSADQALGWVLQYLLDQLAHHP